MFSNSLYIISLNMLFIFIRNFFMHLGKVMEEASGRFSELIPVVLFPRLSGFVPSSVQ